uniref:Uncharacterized protein n=1 Tax=Oryza meridionalis TaxID=40149 RepID=A0A0E0DFM1_9ORYZ
MSCAYSARPASGGRQVTRGIDAQRYSAAQEEDTSLISAIGGAPASEIHDATTSSSSSIVSTLASLLLRVIVVFHSLEKKGKKD